MLKEARVVVVRHAEKDPQTKHLTEQGRELARRRGEQLGEFSSVYSTSKPRGRETAQLMTGQEPIIDERAGFMEFTEKQEERRNQLGETHPLGSVGIFEDPEFQPLVAVSGQLLVVLIKEIIERGGQALIVSHDFSMIAAEKILLQQPLDKTEKRYGYLQGFEVNDRLEPKPI